MGGDLRLVLGYVALGVLSAPAFMLIWRWSLEEEHIPPRPISAKLLGICMLGWPMALVVIVLPICLGRLCRSLRRGQ